MEEATLALLVDTVKNSSNARKRYSFILGAGASRSSGIRTGAEMAKEWLEELEKENEKATQEWLRKENINKNDPGSHYSKIYERRFYMEGEVGLNKLKKEMENAIPSPGYYYLAEMLVKTQNKLVITTNFDNLTENSLFIFEGIEASVIPHENLSGYIDALSNIPTVIKIHRDLFLQPKNKEDDVKILSKKMMKGLKEIMDIYVPIVIGYGGNDGSLMGFLENIASKDKNIYWCHKKGNPVNERIRHLIEKYHGFLIPIYDFDDTMYQFGVAFGYDFSDKTIHNITNELARKLIEKYNEWMSNRRKSSFINNNRITNMQEKTVKEKTKSNTETMSFESYKDLFSSDDSELLHAR